MRAVVCAAALVITCAMAAHAQAWNQDPSSPNGPDHESRESTSRFEEAASARAAVQESGNIAITAFALDKFLRSFGPPLGECG